MRDYRRQRAPIGRTVPPEVWALLPLSMRRRWWTETNYGTREPKDELLKAINEAAKAAKAASASER